MSEDDVTRAILKPMRAMYPPPRHVRADEDAMELALDAYRRGLARFDLPVLQEAWRRVVERNALWCWPKIAELVTAAESVHRRTRSKCEFDARGEAEAQAETYTGRFMKSSVVAARAREGGYESSLRDYVRAAAYVQAQYIAGRTGVGYDGVTLFGGGPRRDREDEEGFFADARKQAETGRIRVLVPRDREERWKEEARGKGRER